jgi:hypothetical protein
MYPFYNVGRFIYSKVPIPSIFIYAVDDMLFIVVHVDVSTLRPE